MSSFRFAQWIINVWIRLWGEPSVGCAREGEKNVKYEVLIVPRQMCDIILPGMFSVNSEFSLVSKIWDCLVYAIHPYLCGNIVIFTVGVETEIKEKLLKMWIIINFCQVGTNSHVIYLQERHIPMLFWKSYFCFLLSIFSIFILLFQKFNYRNRFN